MKIIPLVLVVLLLITPSASLYFELNTTFCFNSVQRENQTYHFYVEAASQNSEESAVVLSIVDKHSVSIIQEQVTHKTMELNASTQLNICLTNPHSYQLFVMIDLWTSSANKLKELASKGQIYQLHSQMYYLSEGIKNISKGEQLQQGRQNLHSSIIIGYESKIKWFGMLKLSLIIGLALIEILVLKYTLQKEDNKFDI